MPTKRRTKKEVSPASHLNGASDKAMRDKSSQEHMAVSSSLHNIHISPRTPKSSRPYSDEEDGFELSLLGEEERRQAAHGTDDEVHPSGNVGKKPMSTEDKRAMVLLCVLCVYFDKSLIHRY